MILKERRRKDYQSKCENRGGEGVKNCQDVPPYSEFSSPITKQKVLKSKSVQSLIIFHETTLPTAHELCSDQPILPGDRADDGPAKELN